MIVMGGIFYSVICCVCTFLFVLLYRNDISETLCVSSGNVSALREGTLQKIPHLQSVAEMCFSHAKKKKKKKRANVFQDFQELEWKATLAGFSVSVMSLF